MDGVTDFFQVPECQVTFWRRFILFDKVPISTIELPKRRVQMCLDVSLSNKLILKSHRPQIKALVRERDLTQSYDKSSYTI